MAMSAPLIAIIAPEVGVGAIDLARAIPTNQDDGVGEPSQPGVRVIF
jgi:hypothetical protein